MLDVQIFQMVNIVKFNEYISYFFPRLYHVIFTTEAPLCQTQLFASYINGGCGTKFCRFTDKDDTQRFCVKYTLALSSN